MATRIETRKVHHPSQNVLSANIRNAKEELKKLLNNEKDPTAPKYAVGFMPDGNTYTLQVRTWYKKDLKFVDQFLENGSFEGFKVEKASGVIRAR